MPPRVQPGEGIVVVLDVGPHTRLGLPIENTFYQQAKLCLINILQRKIFADKCRDRVGVVLLGTDGTDNPLFNPGQYEHITVMQEPRVVDWACVEAAQDLPRGSHSADWLDALIVAIDLLHDPKREVYSATKIVLLTDFSGDFSDDQTDAIVAGIKAIGADLSIIGPDVSDENASEGSGAPISWNGKPKTTVQRAGEAVAASIVQAVDGIMCTFEEAIPQLVFFQKKTSGSTNWNTLLTIGEDLRIPVTGRIKMKRATMDTWKRCHATDETVMTIKERSHHRTDDQQTAVPDEDVIDGYRYGTTLVPFTDEDRQMNYSSGAESAELSVLGFTRSEYCTLAERSGDQVVLITAREEDEEAALALSAVVQALAELDMVAIVRRVYRRNSNPVMGALYPHITQDYECLVFVALPYQEDVRALAFPSLQRPIESLATTQTQAIDALIDSMSLCTADEDGEEDLLEPESVLNPHLQHYYNCLTDRALNLVRPLPQPHPHVLALLSVPGELQEALASVTDTLVQAFPTTKIVKRTKRERENIFGDDEDANESKRSRDDDEEAAGNGDVATAAPPVILGPRISGISTATPRQDFQALLSQQPHNFFSLCDELSEVLLQIVETITPGCLSSPAERASIDKIITCIEVFRKECLTNSPDVYNKFMRSKRALCAGRGVLREVWGRVAEAQVGLITTVETLKSSVTEHEAKDFLSVEAQTPEKAPQPVTPQVQQDYDDLLDDL